MQSRPMTRELKTILKIINEQSSMIQALISVLAKHGLVSKSEVRETHLVKSTAGAKNNLLFFLL